MLKKNIAANLIGRAWGFVSLYLFVPFYLKFLGIDSYALVGFYSTLLGILSFADLGFTATLTREMARLATSQDADKAKRNLLRTYELAYAVVTLMLMAAVWFLAPWIGMNWLHSNTMTAQELTEVIRWMGAAIALQLPAGLYAGGLMGLQKQIHANVIQVIWGGVRGVGGILVLWLLSPTILAFAIWQLIANLIYLFTVRYTVWKAIPPSPGMGRPQFSMDVIHGTWRYALGMSGMTLISTLLIQADKVVASNLLPLTSLGYYMLAGTLALIPVSAATPIGMALFPRFTELVACGDREQLVALYHRATQLLALFIIPAGLVVALCSRLAIFAWTGSTEAAQQAELTATFLAMGQLLQALMVGPYYLALANGNTKLNLIVGVISLVLLMPLLPLLIAQFGAPGGGLSWFLMNILVLPAFMVVFHHKFLHGELTKWFTRSLMIPLLAALPPVLVARYLASPTDSRLLAFLTIVLAWGGASLLVLLTSPTMRQKVRHLLKSRRGFAMSINKA
ncbi:Polysaccharide biosynthesis protein [compost metagenome]